MARRLLLLSLAIILPGGFIALGLAWIGTRPDVKQRIDELGARIRMWMGRQRSTQVLVKVPVAASRCDDTTTFRPMSSAA